MMGRNFISVCDYCGEYLMHFRGKEGDHMQQFANDHVAHKSNIRVLDDYVEEQPEGYEDVFDKYNPDWEAKLKDPSPKSKPMTSDSEGVRNG